MTKEGYQPIKKETIKIIPPNTGSHVYMKKDSYTWEDMDRSYWEGFDTAKGKMEKRIEELEKQNAKLKEIITKMNNVITETFSKLTKAKEFLNEFMRISKAIDEDFDHDYSELIGETDQFLKEKA